VIFQVFFVVQAS